MTKKLLLLVALIATTTFTYAQYTLSFESDESGHYSLGKLWGSGDIVTTIVANPHLTGTNNVASDVLKVDKTSGQNDWHSPQINIISPPAPIGSIVSGNGKFIKIDILTPKAEGKINFRLNTGGTWERSVDYTGHTPNTWYTLTFDFSAEASFADAAFQILFDVGTGTTTADETYYIDNIRQVSSATASLEDVSLSHIKLYPNPTTGSLTISDVSEVNSISIHDILGRKIKQINKVEKTIDISDLPNGVYMLQTDNGLKRKVVKQ